jgi:phosphoglycerol transferase MdoB-like AlkP superfamily enzyme
MTSKTDPNEYKSKDKVCELHGYSMAARQRATIRGATRQSVKRSNGMQNKKQIITNQSHSTISGLFTYFVFSCKKLSP